MKKQILISGLMFVSMLLSNTIQDDKYLYDEDIITDTGEYIKAREYSKRFDGYCDNIKKDKQKRQEYLIATKKAHKKKLNTDKRGLKYYDMQDLKYDPNYLYRLYIFENDTLENVYKIMREYKNYMDEKQLQDFGFLNLVQNLPRKDFQEILQTSLGFDGRRCYFYEDKQSLWIVKIGPPLGRNTFGFFQTLNSVEVLVDFSWGYNYD